MVSDLRQVGVFSPGTLISSTNKTDRHDINTIKQTKRKSMSIDGDLWTVVFFHR